MKQIFILVLLALCIQAEAATNRAVTCHGCSAASMSRAATRATDRGTVYVFNEASASVRKYSVFTEVIDTQPYTVWKQALEKSVEPDLAEAYTDFAQAMGEQNQGHYPLPSDFPIRSVAGALIDPAYSTTHLEDYLSDLFVLRQAELHASNIISRLVSAAVRLIDVKSVLGAIRITIEFPDGSTQEYTMDYSINAVSLKPQAELTPFGNARLANGQPAPTNRLAFDGHTFRDHNGSLREWSEWARMNGVSVSGGYSGTVMVCEISGDEIRCTVKKQP